MRARTPGWGFHSRLEDCVRAPGARVMGDASHVAYTREDGEWEILPLVSTGEIATKRGGTLRSPHTPKCGFCICGWV